MTIDDLQYICINTGSLAGIPVRLYEEGHLILYHSLTDLPKDPIQLYEEEILKIRHHISYYVTPEYHYYGMVCAWPYQMVLGPTRQVDSSESELRRMAFLLSIEPEKRNAFVQGMQKLVRFPLDSLLLMLCSLNFMLNHEKLYLSDISVEGSQLTPPPDRQGDAFEKALYPDTQQQEYYTSYDLEKQLMHIVHQGDTSALEAWMKNAPAIRAGILSDSEMRQFKNLLIVSAALASRQAISGGLDERTAFLLSDFYIREGERMTSPGDLTRLQAAMFKDYTGRVSRIRAVGSTPLALRIASYVQNHLDEVIRIDDLSRHLMMSRSALQAKFKEETGQTLTDFVLHIKIEEAKRLLLFSHQSIDAISEYLAFSSQSHLTRVFKKYTGLTPSAWRHGSRNAH
ncbi:MAG: helix-turn-helix domain-containing protein [Firmicutes bacterium]|nr:helix-turn-helix domain-containing protein [Bacillota bacterium]